MLISREVLDRIAAGEVDLAFRYWSQPTVKVGTQLRTAVGVVSVDAVEVVDPAEITEEDVRRSGAPSRDAVLSRRRGDPDLPDDRVLYRIRLHLAGPDPRVALRERADLDADEVAEIAARLQRLDRASKHGSWTRATLELIEAHPTTRAADLAAGAGRPKDRFKTDVRKLKNLGLTESLEIGYRLSPRGQAYLAAVREGS